MSSALVSGFNPAHYERAAGGDVFLFNTPGQALLLSATTGECPTIINPLGSGKNFVPLALRLSFLSGTTTIGGVLIAQTLNVGGGPATGAPIISATLVAPVSAYVGGSTASQMKWSPTTNEFTAAPTVISAALNLGAAAPTGTGNYETQFDGSLVFAPGTAMSIVYSVATSTALFFVTIVGAEIDV
jgi:hypothetical protein